MKTTDDKELEGEARSLMTSGWGVHARIEPAHERPEQRTLTLGVSDGPECYEDFDPLKALENIGDTVGVKPPSDDDSEGTLLHAIGAVATAIAEERARDEAFHWIHEHEDTYVVLGYTGQTSWPVRAFLREDRANDYAEMLNEWCLEHGFSGPGLVEKYGVAIRDLRHCPDRKFDYDHETGTRYSVQTLPIDMAHAWSDVDPKDR